MTIKELIKELNKYPEDMRVIFPFRGDGGGYESIDTARKKKISLFWNGGGSYYGEMTDYEDDKRDMTYKKIGSDKKFRMFVDHFEALVLG